MNLNNHLTDISGTNTHVVSNKLLYALLISYRDYLVTVYNQVNIDRKPSKENKNKLLAKISKYNEKIFYLQNKLESEDK